MGKGGRGGRGRSGFGFFSFFVFFSFFCFFSLFLLSFEETEPPSPIISFFTCSSENSLVKASCRDLSFKLSFFELDLDLDFFDLVLIESFPRSKSSTPSPGSPKLDKRSGQFLAIKSWISSSLIPPSLLSSCSFLLSSPLLKNRSSSSFSSMLLKPRKRTFAVPFFLLMLSITAS